MKKLITLSLIILVFSSFTMFQSMVYVCKGTSSKVYHKSERCRGLSNCSSKTEKITEDEAKKMGRRQCKIEY